MNLFVLNDGTFQNTKSLSMIRRNDQR
jgi:hypothetical protein